MNMGMHRIKIAVSGCLLGEKIRYDGGDKKLDFLFSKETELFEFIPFCPEVEMGLGIPRAPIQLMRKNGAIHLVVVGDSLIDHTKLALKTFNKLIKEIVDVSGVILMAGSPSCGFNFINVFDEKGDVTDKGSRGLWANFLKENLLKIPMIDSSELESQIKRDEFFREVNSFQNTKSKV